MVSRVNSKFSTISYQPIVFLHQDISFSQYLALLTAADTSLITPLRDGMNLTSHEYIVCQENNHGPLILSEVRIHLYMYMTLLLTLCSSSLALMAALEHVYE